MSPSTGILLVNLGTPLSPNPRDVYRYLIEFLTDGRVIDSPWFIRQLLVRGLIVPFRYRQSAKAYQEIWTKQGSPLLIHGQKITEKLQIQLGDDFSVVLAMRYQEPSIRQGIDTLLKQGIKRLLILPLFPQYASATTGSVHQEVMKVLKNTQVIPELLFIDQFATNPAMIQTFVTIGQTYQPHTYDHILFSFHGLPQRHIQKADRSATCLSTKCCEKLGPHNQQCYTAQCHATAKGIATGLQLSPENYSICFQSRLGKEPWLTPYTSATIHQLAKEGKKKVLVFCPSFVCDCLETTYEIGIEYAQEFIKAGGDRLELVRGLNDHPEWISTLENLVTSRYALA